MRTKKLERVGMVLLDGMQVRATFFLKGGGYRHHLIDADSATYERLVRAVFYPHRPVRKSRNPLSSASGGDQTQGGPSRRRRPARKGA